MKFLIAAILSISFLLVSNSNAEQKPYIDWPKNKSAVAWKTTKKMFLFKTVEPVGINSDLTFAVKKTANGKVVIINIPVDKFNSGEKDRDESVIEILKGAEFNNVIFTSEEIGDEKWSKILQNKVHRINGDLAVAGKSFNFDLSIELYGEGNDQFIIGAIFTKFESLNLESPSVAGGLIANVSDDVQLQAKLYVRDIVAK